MAKTGKYGNKNQPINQIGKKEDVHYRADQADANDIEAQQRANAADRRQET